MEKKASKLHGVTGVCERSDGVCIVHVVRRKDQPPVLAACEFAECPDESRRSRVLQDAIRRHGLRGTRSVGVLPLGSYSLLQVEPPEVPESEIRDAVSWNIRDLIDFPLAEAVIDYFPAPFEGARSRSRIGYAVAAPLSQVKNRVVHLRESRCKISAVDIPELALRNVAALMPEQNKGVAFLHLDRHQSLIIIVRDSALYLARNLNVGVADLFEFSGLDAQIDILDMAPRFRDMLDSIVLEVQRSFDFYESHFSQSPISQLVVAPTEMKVPALIPYLRDVLGVSVQPLDVGALLGLESLPEEVAGVCLTAIGAALRDERGGM